jgi:hypothetical protein
MSMNSPVTITASGGNRRAAVSDHGLQAEALSPLSISEKAI